MRIAFAAAWLFAGSPCALAVSEWPEPADATAEHLDLEAQPDSAPAAAAASEAAADAATAPAQTSDAENPCADWAPIDEEMIDGTRRYLHQTLCSSAMWFDGLFGDQRNVEAARGVSGRLETSAAYSEYYGEKTASARSRSARKTSTGAAR